MRKFEECRYTHAFLVKLFVFEFLIQSATCTNCNIIAEIYFFYFGLYICFIRKMAVVFCHWLRKSKIVMKNEQLTNYNVNVSDETRFVSGDSYT